MAGNQNLSVTSELKWGRSDRYGYQPTYLESVEQQFPARAVPADGQQASLTEPEFCDLSALFEAEYDMVYRFCLARTASAQIAEDATGETFADAARLYATGRGREVDPQWLRSVARSRVIDQWRADERHRRRVRRLVHLRDQNHPAETDFDEERVLVALRAVPERQRSALTLRYLDGYGVDEIADILEVSYQAAESLLARGRRSFGKALGEGP